MPEKVEQLEQIIKYNEWYIDNINQNNNKYESYDKSNNKHNKTSVKIKINDDLFFSTNVDFGSIDYFTSLNDWYSRDRIAKRDDQSGINSYYTSTYKYGQSMPDFSHVLGYNDSLGIIIVKHKNGPGCIHVTGFLEEVLSVPDNHDKLIIRILIDDLPKIEITEEDYFYPKKNTYPLEGKKTPKTITTTLGKYINEIDTKKLVKDTGFVTFKPFCYEKEIILAVEPVNLTQELGGIKKVYDHIINCTQITLKTCLFHRKKKKKIKKKKNFFIIFEK